MATAAHEAHPHDLHKELELVETETQFLISSSTNTLALDRQTEAIEVKTSPATSGQASKKIYGILGLVQLLRGKYLVVITDKHDAGHVQGHKLWRVTGTQVIPFRPNAPLDARQQEDEDKFLRMIRLVLDLPNMYFSYTYDITHTYQRIKEMSEEALASPKWSRADTRFFWNRHLQEPLITAAEQNTDVSNYILPVIVGYIGIGHLTFSPPIGLSFALISRRNVKRPGTRFWVRGLDEDGNPANNVETEQIILADHGEVSSFVQTRGSIPVRWTQYVNMTWAPKPQILPDSLEFFSKHFDEQVRIYGEPQLLVNLANHHGSEGRLVDGYGKHAMEYKGRLHYIAFDFHKECPGINWSKLHSLTASVSSHVEEIGYFSVKDGKVVRRQSGTVRTNCIDNLDRTNVLQSLFARSFLEGQLRSIGVLTGSDTIESHKELDSFLRNAWADNADYISKQYAGAGALKTDFTRTGKRTTLGLINDGVNAIQRYIVNNFYDGFKQDALNLFLGYYSVKTAQNSPFGRDSDFYRNSIFALVGGLLVVLIAGSIMNPVSASTWNLRLMAVACWGGALAGIRFGVQKFGSKLVNRPVLIPPVELAKPKLD